MEYPFDRRGCAATPLAFVKAFLQPKTAVVKRVGLIFSPDGCILKPFRNGQKQNGVTDYGNRGDHQEREE